MTKKIVPVQKNEYYDVKIESLTHDGLGVARVDGFPVFVANALVGEEINMKVTLVKKTYAFGRAVDYFVTSGERVKPECGIYKQCGGCQVQHLSYEGQLKMKHDTVVNHLKRIGHIEDANVLPTIGMQNPSRYRNKTQVPFGYADGKVVAGFYQKRSHEIINMQSCLIQTDISDQIVETMRQLCQELEIDPYNESLNLGVLRHVIVRVGFKTEEIMVTLVTRTHEIPNSELLIQRLVSKYPKIKSIAQNVNPKVTNVIFGDETRILYGEPYIYDEMNGIRFAISPRSFYQVNPIQTETLYSKAVEYAQLSGNEIVFDAYCGIGTITLFLAQHAKQVYGVEIIPEAIEDAKMNARLNGFENTQFAVGKSEEIIPAWIENGIVPDVIVVDPPRKGCDRSLLDTMLEAAPDRIVYVSCDSSTLARDLRVLIDGGYKLEVVQPVDMFPQTAHIECVAKLVRA
ncbi:MAG: 23S rRNA (uracil(1939)-C(5))-methyltransferase RlmD [Turicibacter sp.]|jgi:23S rRNA (uracil1939-C5)-methyltransferase|nr:MULTISPECIES: 23S rRNA (uracil(1939)-C(5))-methyltransferase RlmD [unclassified Turicibacter]MCI8701536.1 23S rRNA (uracil(1939)-C(5))-methyltransferase RlmD [Turicibacter sp.]MCI9350677.1 23S rRNA (uracil(1939)-C(5))-methyltransferase RlmD [Turicibacter sp.]MCU7205287.1 23S rRNA (uracil(1939)-C(5))-methyltransferase RlmD [Turicibacter sp. TA25]MCU7209943.1 23S rRNA (uracil(1939)-C(5))-methyltransferase RlmD [Turicibacter sp. 1E2]